MRIKKQKKNFAERAYQNTPVDSAHTQSQIEKLLSELGITDIRVTKVANDYHFEFLARIRKDESPRKVRIDIPINTELDDGEEDYARRRNILFRVLYWHLKSKFVAITNRLVEFEDAFLGDILIVHNGKEQRISDILVPMVKAQLKDSSMVTLKIEQPK